MRLDKFLSSAMGLGSRTDVKKFIKNGRVEVIGTDNPRPELSIDPENPKCILMVNFRNTKNLFT